MKKNIFYFFMFVAVLSVSCKQNKNPEIKTVDNSSEEVVSNSEDAEWATTTFKIKGMTCEMGCARTIENKLNHSKGVKSAKIDFETETAEVEFDKNTINESEIDAIVESVGDGETYKVEHL